jgi:hypothetical protein
MSPAGNFHINQDMITIAAPDAPRPRHFGDDVLDRCAHRLSTVRPVAPHRNPVGTGTRGVRAKIASAVRP